MPEELKQELRDRLEQTVQFKTLRDINKNDFVKIFTKEQIEEVLSFDLGERGYPLRLGDADKKEKDMRWVYIALNCMPLERKQEIAERMKDSDDRTANSLVDEQKKRFFSEVGNPSLKKRKTSTDLKDWYES